MKVQDESQQTKEKLFKMAHTKMGAQNTNIRMMETRLKDLQKMCDQYQQILDKDMKLFNPKSIEEMQVKDLKDFQKT